jgi:hypothetical protein
MINDFISIIKLSKHSTIIKIFINNRINNHKHLLSFSEIDNFRFSFFLLLDFLLWMTYFWLWSFKL